jgi:HSP20 family protein
MLTAHGKLRKIILALKVQECCQTIIKELSIMRGLVPFGKYGVPGRTGFDDLHRMLDEIFEGSGIPGFLPMNTFRVDVQENDEEYCVEAELPGVKREEIGVSTDDGRVTISVNRSRTVEQTEKNYVHRERSSSSMQRSLFLDDISSDGIKAKLDNGVLRLNIKKQKQDRRSNDIVIE